MAQFDKRDRTGLVRLVRMGATQCTRIIALLHIPSWISSTFASASG